VLLTAEDIPGENGLADSRVPVLAGGELSYIGEPVALLLGPDRDGLEKIARDCKVVAEEDEPVFSTADAAGAGARTVAARREIRVGDPEAAFAGAASTVKSDYETGIQEHWYPEPCGAVAWTEPEADPERAEGQPRLVVRTATQWPFHVRRSVARVLGDAAVRVEPCAVDPSLDGKLWYPSLVSCHAALGALITGRPVRMVLSRKEDFCFSPKRFGASISVSSAFDEKGELVGTMVEASANMGAYGVGAAEALDQLCLGCLGIHSARNAGFTGTAYMTNIPPQGHFAGLGLAQGSFAMERHVSLVADGRRQDPAEWRRENFPKAGTLSPGLPIADAIPWERLVDAARDMSDYSRKWASYELLRRKRGEQPPQDDSPRAEGLRGIGIALGYQGNGPLHPGPDGGGYGVELTLEKDGSLEIKTGMPGASGRTAWSDIALGILGVEAGNVRVNGEIDEEPGDPAPGALESGPATMSRKTTALAELVERACLAIQALRFRDPLPISARETAAPLEDPEWTGRFPLPQGSPDRAGFLRPGSAAAVVEVELDPVEYLPKIRGVWLAVDGGRVFQEDRARRSLKLSVVQALGWACREQPAYVSGRVPEDCFDGFDIAGASEIPPVEIGFVRDSSEKPKGIGDLPFACVPAAYLQAVSQMMDRHFRSIPLKTLYADAAGGKEGDAQ